jgi:hypothetical protein
VKEHGPGATPVPLDSIVFGYGPMLPFVCAAVGAWVFDAPWPGMAVVLAIIWGAMILSFVAGVRRGYGFGSRAANTRAEIVSMIAYFVPAGLSLILVSFGRPAPALWVLVIGFALVIMLDQRAARAGDAPTYFARLRLPQMSIAIASLVVLVLRIPN